MAGAIATGDLVTATWLTEVERRKPTRATVATQQTTTSASYVDLATVGPAVTVTTGTTALVILSAAIYNASASQATFMSFAVSGATTIAASDATVVHTFQSTAGGTEVTASNTFLVTGLTAGSNTFTAKYKVSGGSTGRFTNRSIIVIPQD